MEQRERSRRGAKRSEPSRMAILTAAFVVNRDRGYGKLTVEGIASEAGVGKQTVYRWWPSKADVLLEALAVKAETRVEVEDHGSFRADAIAFLRSSFDLLRFPGVTEALRSLMAEAQVDPEFASRFRAGFLDVRRAAFLDLLRRAAERGDAPSLAPETATDLVFGTIWYRILATDRTLSDEDAETLAEILTLGGDR